MRDVHAHDQAVVNVYELSQRDLDLETKSEMVSVRFYPSEIPILKAHAEAAGTNKLGNHIRNIVIKYLKSERHLKSLHSTLDDMFP